MNVNKAREYFSAYFEGSLDRGLKQSFEQALGQDAQLQAEYKAFERTMAELATMSANEVEPPADLHDRIVARLDRHVWEQKQAKPGGIGAWWHRLAIGVAATAVLAIALVQLNSNSQTSSAGIVPVPVNSGKSKVSLGISPKGLTLSHSQATLSITLLDSEGKEIDSVTLNNERLEGKLLANSSEHAQLVGIAVSGKQVLWVAIPGSKRTPLEKAAGSIKDLARALANAYGKPVSVDAAKASLKVSWAAGDEIVAVAKEAVNRHSLGVELRPVDSGEILWIQ